MSGFRRLDTSIGRELAFIIAVIAVIASTSDEILEKRQADVSDAIVRKGDGDAGIGIIRVDARVITRWRSVGGWESLCREIGRGEVLDRAVVAELLGDVVEADGREERGSIRSVEFGQDGGAIVTIICRGDGGKGRARGVLGLVAHGALGVGRGERGEGNGGEAGV